MTPEEIKIEIDKLNAEIEECFVSNIFILNSKIAPYQEEIMELQSICPHVYDDEGKCIYCYHQEAQHD